VDIKQIIDFINSDDEQTKLPLQSGKKISYLPTKNFRLKVDSANCVNSGLVPKEMAAGW